MKKLLSLLLIITTVTPLLSSCVPESWKSPEESTAPVPIMPDTTGRAPDTDNVPGDDIDMTHDEYGFTLFAPGDYLANPMFDTDEYLPGYDAENAFIVPGYSKNGGICSDGETVYYFAEDPEDRDRTYLMYRDRATGEGGPLCSKPDCAHDGSGCDAYFLVSCSDMHGLHLYDGKLYWSTNMNINRISTDGANRERVATVRDGMFPEYSFNSAMTAVPHRGYVYYGGLHSELVGYENGTGNTIRKYTIRIGAEPTDGGGDGFVIFERETIYDDASCNYRFVGNDMYIMIEDYDITDDSLGDGRKVELYRWSSKTRKAELLFDCPGTWDEDGAQAYINVGGGFSVLEDGIYLYAEVTAGNLVYYRGGYMKYSFESGQLGDVVWLGENTEILPFLSDGRVYAYTADSILTYGLDGELIEEKDVSAASFVFVGADDGYMYFGYIYVTGDWEPNGVHPPFTNHEIATCYVAVPFGGTEMITLEKGEPK